MFHYLKVKEQTIHIAKVKQNHIKSYNILIYFDDIKSNKLDYIVLSNII